MRHTFPPPFDIARSRRCGAQAPRRDLLLVMWAVACGVSFGVACPSNREAGQNAERNADGAADAGGSRAAMSSITGLSPRSTSNAFATPLLVFGRGLAAGQRLRLGAPCSMEVPLVVDDVLHAHALVPAGLQIPAAATEAVCLVSLVSEQGEAQGDALDLAVVNDMNFVDVHDLVATPDLGIVATASTTTDELLFLDRASGTVSRVAVGDGPAALARAELDGRFVVVVAHQFSPQLHLVDLRPGPDGARTTRILPGPAHARAVLVRDKVVYVAEHARDTLVAVDLETGRVRWTTPVDPNPGALAFTTAGEKIAVGSLVAGEVQLISLQDGTSSRGIAPRPGVRILGGHTEAFADDVMGGKGVRALAAGDGALFVASTGPNIGPNDKKMEVSGVGGVGVIDVKSATYPRHLAFDFGVAQALALDARRGRLYVADIAEGLVHVVDARALLGKDEPKARRAWLGSTPLPVPEGFPLVRDVADFGGPNRRRAGVEVHTGPSALALSQDGKNLAVLERFTGRITFLDVTGELPRVRDSHAVFDPLVQRDRRLGQVLYFADLGRTGMSCDACHLEGHSEGVFFTKTGMMRIWRSTTNRGVRDTPPYFNPPAHPTVEDMAAYVGSRNRFQNPPMSPSEVEQLSTFVRSYTTLPNPFRDATGGMLPDLELTDGRHGRPDAGRVIFEARCAGCHPPPLFSTDQDETTRRRFQKVGTPLAMDLRVSQQDTSFVVRTPPSLVGAWDVWPMLLTGAAGYRVSAEGPWLEVADRAPIRAVLERYSPRPHGDAMSLSEEERRDLEAYVLSL